MFGMKPRTLTAALTGIVFAVGAGSLAGTAGAHEANMKVHNPVLSQNERARIEAPQLAERRTSEETVDPRSGRTRADNPATGTFLNEQLRTPDVINQPDTRGQ